LLTNMNQERHRVPRLARIWFDGGFSGPDFLHWVMDICHWIADALRSGNPTMEAHQAVDVVLRPNGSKGFVLLPKRWTVERTYGIEALIDGEFFNAQFRSIEFGNSLISIPYSAYRLSFEPVESLLIIHPNISIQIKEFNLNMFVSQGEFKLPEVGNPIYSKSAIPLVTAAVQTFTLATPRVRRSALITNKTSRTLYLKEGSAASAPTLTAADPFTSVPAGGSYGVEEYNGEIVGLLASGNAKAGDVIIVKEMPFVVAPAAPTANA
jgi:transposase